MKLDYTWTKGGFDNVMMANFTVHNPSTFRIKDIEVTCTSFAPSGTQIDDNKRTIYEIVPAKSTRHFNDFNMGFIVSQVKSTACRVSDLVVY